MAETDYIPGAQSEFNDFQKQFVKGLLTDPVTGSPAPFPPAPGADPANWENWEIDQPDMQGLLDEQANYQPTYDDWSDEDARNHDKVVALEEAREDYEELIRTFVGEWLRENKKVNNAAKAILGLTVPDEERTAVTPVDHGPRLALHDIKPLVHKIRITDPETPDSKAMPKGHKAVLDRFIGKAGLEAGEIDWEVYKQTGRFLADSTFTAVDKGKSAYYRARYVTTRGDFTVYSNTLEEVIS